MYEPENNEPENNKLDTTKIKEEIITSKKIEYEIIRYNENELESFGNVGLEAYFGVEMDQLLKAVLSSDKIEKRKCLSQLDLISRMLRINHNYTRSQIDSLWWNSFEMSLLFLSKNDQDRINKAMKNLIQKYEK